MDDWGEEELRNILALIYFGEHLYTKGDINFSNENEAYEAFKFETGDINFLIA